MSKIPALNVSFSRPEVIVFVEQSDSIADVSIQRGSIALLVTIITVVPDELFQGRRVDRWTFVVDLFGFGRNPMRKEAFAICETCPIVAEAVSFH